MLPGCKSFAILSVVLGAIGSVPAHAETIRVSIDKLVFSPANISAKVGDTIEWVNDVFWRIPLRSRVIGMS